MKSWKLRLGLMLTMLAMLLAVAVPASAQTLYAQYPPGECWVDEWGYTWCPWDPSLVAPAAAAAPVVETDEQVVEEEADLESEIENIEDFFGDLEDLDEEIDEAEFDFDEDEFDEDEFDFDEDEFDEDELNRLLISDFDDDDDDDDDEEDDEEEFIEEFLLEEF